MNVSTKHTIVRLVCAMLLLLVVTHTALADQAEQLYAEGKRLYEQGDYAEAIAILRQVVGLKPDSGMSWLKMAQCYEKLDKCQDAVKAVDKALLYLAPETEERQEALTLQDRCNDEPSPPAPPPTPTPEDLLGEAFREANWARVIELGGKIAQSADSPKYRDAHYFVGIAYLQQDRESPEALRYLRKYLELAPDGDYEQAVKLIVEPLDNNMFYTVVAEIEEALDRGNLDDAHNKIQTAEGMRKAGHDLTYLNGLRFVLGGQEDKAIREFERYRLDAPSGRFVHSCGVWLHQLRSPWLIVIRNDQVLRIFTDGTKPRAISRVGEHGKAEQALISPDGRMIAFIAWNEKPNTRNVFVCDAFGGEPHGIFESGGDQSAIRDLHWFQHERGLWLTFVGEDKTRDYGIFLYDASRSGRAFMLEGSRSSPTEAKNLRCQWSPDAEYLAWTGGDGYLRVAGLFALSTPAMLEDRFEVPAFAWGPRVTNDLPGSLIWASGKRVFRRLITPEFLIPSGRPADTYINISGSQPHIAQLGVSADGTVIGAWDGKSETLHLYVAHPRKSSLGTIDRVQRFAFSKVGRQLAYSTPESIYVTNMVPDIPPTRVQGTWGTTEFAWSPETMELLVWQSDWVCLTVDGKRRADGLTREAEGPFVQPRWSPGACRVAIQRNVTSARELGSIWILSKELPEAEQLHLVLPREQGPFYLVGWTS